MPSAAIRGLYGGFISAATTRPRFYTETAFSLVRQRAAIVSAPIGYEKMTTFDVYPHRTATSPATRERHRWQSPLRLFTCVLDLFRKVEDDARSLAGLFEEAWLAPLQRLGHALIPRHTPQAQAATSTAPLIRFTRERLGGWTVVAADEPPRTGFADIEDAVAYARDACDAAPATLWLDIDGLVVVTTQDAGWTRPLIGEKT
jgi:hypothetical protein